MNRSIPVQSIAAITWTYVSATRFLVVVAAVNAANGMRTTAAAERGSLALRALELRRWVNRLSVMVSCRDVSVPRG